ncbi:MAG: PBP1A family penicillin-binding protein [Alphaproteobacteria bacterium]|nr:PBP1A family penicillin-binding protein [Alphaproteobacteria bacterium]
MKAISRFFAYLICSVIAIVGCGGAVIFFGLYFFSADLPNHNSLKHYSPDVATRVFLQDGRKLCEYANEKRYFIPIDRIPPKLINAFISVEDKHFFEHKGVDFIGIARSVIKNIEKIKAGKRPQGASTITQQVARIFLIKSNEVSYIRKIKEAILSFRIESTLTKKHILELYLNQIYLGSGVYGVAAAAKIYFDKTVDELTIAECSYLASLAKGANNYHPIKHKDKAIERRNWAISRQLEDGYITTEQAKKAISEDLQVVAYTSDETSEYFAEEIRKYLIEKLNIRSLNTEGLIVRSTLDTQMQQCAYNALRKGLEEVDRRFGWRGAITALDMSRSAKEIFADLQDIAKPKGGEPFIKAVVVSVKDNKEATVATEFGKRGKMLPADIKWAKNLKRGDVVLVDLISSGKNQGMYTLKQIPQVQGAIVVIETETGRILAMQGGYSFDQSEFNRVTQAERQIGSAFKPFVYLAGLENGFAPNSIVDASPVSIDLGEKLGVWQPRNYKGAILDKLTFRQGIERSVNTCTIRIAQEVGLDKIATIAEQFGVFEHMPQMLSYVLGAGETTLLKLTTAYAMFANGGKRIHPIMVDYVQDRYGKVIYLAEERKAEEDIPFDDKYPPRLNDNREQILSEQSIYQLTSLLEGVMIRGSGASAAFLNIPMAGKTGTSNESRDTWFIGYTPDIAVGVFVGFDGDSQTLGKNANGTNTALPIFINFMSEAKKFIKQKPFRVPHGIKQRKIDADTGGLPSETTRRTIIETFKEDDSLPTEEKVLSEEIIQNDTSSSDITAVSGIY